MDTDSLRRLQVIQLDKERGELSEKLRQTGKRIDHFERALRREEIPLLNDDYEAQLATEKEKYEESKRQKLALAAARHKQNLQLKRQLERIMPDYQTYREIIKDKRSEEFQARENEAKAALEAEKARRKAAFKKRQEEIRRAEEERIRREQEEAERSRKEEEERLAKEEAARKEAEEKARKREEERRYHTFWVHKLISLGKQMKFWRNRNNENGKLRRRLLVVEQQFLKLLKDLPLHPWPVLKPRQMRGVQLPVEPKARLLLNHTDHLEEVAAGATVPRLIDHLIDPLPLTEAPLDQMFHLVMLLPTMAHKRPRLPHLDDTFHPTGEDKSHRVLIVEG